MSILSVNRFT